MGRNHERVLRQLGHEVVTIDPDPDAGADHQTLATNLVDWVEVACIAVPIDQLAWVAERWLNWDKDVLVEKPGSTSFDQLLDLHALADSKGRKLFVGYTERHNAVVKRLRDTMFLVGQIRHINARRLGRSIDGGFDAALDLVVHDLDVLDALGFQFDLRWSLGVPLDSQRHVSLLLTDRDSTCSIGVEASHLHPAKTREIEIVGDDGVLVADYSARTLHCFTDDEAGELLVDGDEPLVAEWRAFFNGDRSDGLAAMRVAEEITAYVEPELAVVN